MSPRVPRGGGDFCIETCVFFKRDTDTEISKYGTTAHDSFITLNNGPFLPHCLFILQSVGAHRFVAELDPFDIDANVEPVAIAAMYVRNKYTWFDFARTLKDYRGWVDQAVLIKALIQDCKCLGCFHLTVVTAEQTPQKLAQSYRNVIRYGFREAYTRQNYIFKV